MASQPPGTGGSITVFRATPVELIKRFGTLSGSPPLDKSLNLTVHLNPQQYAAVEKSPLLYQEILDSVSDWILGPGGFGREFVKEYEARKAKDGTVISAQSSLVWRSVTSRVGFRVETIIKEKGDRAAEWRKTKKDHILKGFTCIAGLGASSAGIAAAVPTFGATAIPSVMGMAKSLAEAAGQLKDYWTNVEKAQSNTEESIYKLGSFAKKYSPVSYHSSTSPAPPPVPGPSGSKTAATGAPISQATGFRSRVGGAASKYGGEVINGVSRATGISHLVRGSVGPSILETKRNLGIWMGKIAHLEHLADLMDEKLQDMLSRNEELVVLSERASSNEMRLAYKNELEGNEATVHKILEEGFKRRRDAGKYRLSISTIKEYTTKAKPLSRKFDDLVNTYKMTAQGSHLLLREQAFDFFSDLGMYLGGKPDMFTKGVGVGLGVVKDGSTSVLGVISLSKQCIAWVDSARTMATTAMRASGSTKVDKAFTAAGVGTVAVGLATDAASAA